MAPAPALCVERKRLMQTLGEAISELIALHNTHIRMVIEGNVETENLDLEIQVARVRKREALEAFLEHIREHGCKF